MLIFDGSVQADFLLVTGDAYVDHPSFGAAIIARVVEGAGFSVAVLSQPRWDGTEDFLAFQRPRLGLLVTSGNIDSMVSHYTAAKKRRSEDVYSPGGVPGKRPDRACIVYASLAKSAFPGLPVIMGGLEASLRRFAHYDFWDDRVRRSILFDAKADLIVYGMGERAIREAAARLNSGLPLDGIPGTCRASKTLPEGAAVCPSFEEVRDNKRAYAEATALQYAEHDPVRGKILAQKHGSRFLVCEKPAAPLSTREMDEVYALPFTRKPIPEADIPATREVQFSLTHNRGCFGGCHFCALAFHQGRMISTRSEESLIREAEILVEARDFKGYIHDVGGPTANMRHPSCREQQGRGMCKRNCLTPKPCPKLDTSHRDYLRLLRRLRALPGIKKVFVRSGIRFDYLMLDQSGACFAELVEHHISGQLKVAPEHCVDGVLDLMGKPRWETFLKFETLYQRLNKRAGKQQYLVPYLISSHPGSTLADAVKLAETLHRMGRRVEQVQDFYPTPGTISTCMYHTGINPLSGQPVYVPKTPREKAMQRALLQWSNSKNRGLVEAALREAGREDLIGYGKGCLIRPRGRPTADGAKRKAASPAKGEQVRHKKKLLHK